MGHYEDGYSGDHEDEHAMAAHLQFVDDTLKVDDGKKP